MKAPEIKLCIEDYGFILFLVASLAWNFGFISQLQQIPSPLYGGDFYNGLGGVNHILGGGSFMESAQMPGEHPWVPWLYHLCVAVFAGITGLGPVKGLLYFSLVVQFLSLPLLYFLAWKATGDKRAALLAAILFSTMFPIMKYGDMANALFVPGLALAIMLFWERRDALSATATGILIGLCSITNTQAFFVANMMFFLYAACMLYPLVKGKKIGMGLLKENRGVLSLLAIAFVVGFAISLLFWFNPIFVFHGQTPNDIQDITYPDVRNFDVFAKVSYSLLAALVLPFGLQGAGALLSLLNVAGIYFVLKRPSGNVIAVVLVLAYLVCVLHSIITLPLIDMQLMGSIMLERISLLTAALLASIGLAGAAGMLRDKNAGLALVAVCLLASLAFVAESFAARDSNQWTQVGRTELAAPHAELEAWIKENTGVNDVFLTTNEDGFMMNALTGRKVVSYRRAHSSPYTDMHARMADQAVMVYGTNSGKTSELLEKYDVKYLLVTYNWVHNEFQISEQGQLAGFFDPLDVPNNAANKAYWDANGVKYLEVTMSMDPAPRENVPLYSLIVALPYPLEQGGPVSPALMGNFRIVKTVYSEGYPVFQIYERVD